MDRLAETDQKMFQDEAEDSSSSKTVTCQKDGNILEMSHDLTCAHPKETCKYRLSCIIYAVGKNR